MVECGILRYFCIIIICMAVVSQLESEKNSQYVIMTL